MRTGPLGKASGESLALLNVTEDKGLFVFRNKSFVEEDVLIYELFFLGECLALRLVGRRGLSRRWGAFSGAVVHGCVERLEEREVSVTVVGWEKCDSRQFLLRGFDDYTGFFPRTMHVIRAQKAQSRTA